MQMVWGDEWGEGEVLPGMGDSGVQWRPGWVSVSFNKMSEVSVKLSYWRAGYIYLWLKFQVAVLQLQAKSCSPLRPKAQLPLASLTPMSSLQGGGSGVLG